MRRKRRRRKRRRREETAHALYEWRVTEPAHILVVVESRRHFMLDHVILELLRVGLKRNFK